MDVSQRVFISYASGDQATADRLVREIEKRGIGCWISSRDVHLGDDYQGSIVSAIEKCGLVLLLFSQNANQSTEIPKELAIASKFHRTIIPARIQDIVPSGAFTYQMSTAQFIDLFHDFENKLDELCGHIADKLETAEQVRLRIAEERKHRTILRDVKLAGAAVIALIVLILAGVIFLPRLWHHEPTVAATQSGATNSAATTAPQASVPQASAQTPAASAPQAAQVQQSAASDSIGLGQTSRIYDGIKFDVTQVKATSQGLMLLVSITNTADETMRVHYLQTQTAAAVDDNGAFLRQYRVEGIPFCYDAERCATADDSSWSTLDHGESASLVLTFNGYGGLDGNHASATFDMQAEPSGDPGGAKTIPVVFLGLPLKEGAPPMKPIAERTKDGLAFSVLGVTNTAQQTIVVLALRAPEAGLLRLNQMPLPQLIDDQANTSQWAEVGGVAICGYSSAQCEMRQIGDWTSVEAGQPLLMVFAFRARGGFGGKLASLSFSTYWSPDKGEARLIEVPFSGLPLSARR